MGVKLTGYWAWQTSANLSRICGEFYVEALRDHAEQLLSMSLTPQEALLRFDEFATRLFAETQQYKWREGRRTLRPYSDNQLAGHFDYHEREWLDPFEFIAPTRRELEELCRLAPEPGPYVLDTAAGRKAAVEDFLKRATKVAGIEIEKTHFWKAAGYKNREQFNRWQRCDPKQTKMADRNFRELLAMKPEDFIALQKANRLLS